MVNFCLSGLLYFLLDRPGTRSDLMKAVPTFILDGRYELGSFAIDGEECLRLRHLLWHAHGEGVPCPPTGNDAIANDCTGARGSRLNVEPPQTGD